VKSDNRLICKNGDKFQQVITLAKTMQGNNIARVFCHDRCRTSQFVIQEKRPLSQVSKFELMGLKIKIKNYQKIGNGIIFLQLGT
jgi:hypothetical protein